MACSKSYMVQLTKYYPPPFSFRSRERGYDPKQCDLFSLLLACQIGYLILQNIVSPSNYAPFIYPPAIVSLSIGAGLVEKSLFERMETRKKKTLPARQAD